MFFYYIIILTYYITSQKFLYNNKAFVLFCYQKTCVFYSSFTNQSLQTLLVVNQSNNRDIHINSFACGKMCIKHKHLVSN